MIPSKPSHKRMNGNTITPQDFHVDQRTGFVPPQMPLRRLPVEWEIWEAILDGAKLGKLKAAEQILLLDSRQRVIDEEKARVWRSSVDKVRKQISSIRTSLIDPCQMPNLSIENLKGCERQLRRAHHVLAFIVQFYTHTIPSTEPIIVPRSLTVPLLRVSIELQHAPFITYYDHALNNWSHKGPHEDDALPTTDNLQAQTTFTGTQEENEFHMTDIRIELEGAKAVESMRLAMDEIMGSDDPDVGRIAEYLNQAADAIEQMKYFLMSTKKLVRPETFYNDIRPWLTGTDDDIWGRKWTWEGSEDIEGSAEMLTKTSAPTAGQSPLVPTLDAYLGLEEDESKRAFLDRVRVYMASSHGVFLQHLRSNGRPVHFFVQKMSRELGVESPVATAYNAAVKAMRGFRDAHLIIVALYVIVPARQAKEKAENPGMKVTLSAKPAGTNSGPVEDNIQDESSGEDIFGKIDGHIGKGTMNGSPEFLLMEFLKGLRDQTK